MKGVCMKKILLVLLMLLVCSVQAQATFPNMSLQDEAKQAWAEKLSAVTDVGFIQQIKRVKAESLESNDIP
jgi:hypothetical protein